MATSNLRVIPIGGIEAHSGVGPPDHIAPSGTTYFDTNSLTLYKNSDGFITWFVDSVSPFEISQLWSGLGNFSGLVSSVSISSTTIFSGSQDLSLVIRNAISGSVAGVQSILSGSNISLGGTAANPSINVIGSPTFTGLTSGTISGTTIFSDKIIASRPILNSEDAVISATTTVGTAVRGISDTGDGGHFQSNSGYGIHVSSDSSTGIIGLSASNYGGELVSLSGIGGFIHSTENIGLIVTSQKTQTPLITQTNDTGYTANISQFWNLSSEGLNIKNDGSLEWTTLTGAENTRINLGISLTGVSSVGAGANAYTGGTSTNPLIGVIGSPTFTGLTSGTISGTSITGQTIFSGSQDLSLIIRNATSGSSGVQSVSAGANTALGGTASNPSINVIGSPIFTGLTSGTFSGTSVTGQTIFSGTNELSRLFLKTGSTYVQSVSAGANTALGGTAANPSINVIGSPNFTGLTVTTTTTLQGTVNLSNATVTVDQALFSGALNKITVFTNYSKFDTAIVEIGRDTIFSASSTSSLFRIERRADFMAQIFSGTNDLGNLFLSTASTLVQSISAGSNISLGGTSTNPSINVIGSPVLTGVTATTINGTTIFENGTSLTNKYAPKNLSINRQATSYTLALTDDSKTIYMTGASSQSLVVPANASIALPIGSQVMVVQTGAGQVTFSAATGVSLLSYSSQLKLLGQYAGASLIKSDTNEWALVGNLTT